MWFDVNASDAVELVMAGLLQAAVFYVGPERSDEGIDFDGVSHKRRRPLNTDICQEGESEICIRFFDNIHFSARI